MGSRQTVVKVQFATLCESVGEHSIVIKIRIFKVGRDTEHRMHFVEINGKFSEASMDAERCRVSSTTATACRRQHHTKAHPAKRHADQPIVVVKST